MKKLVCLVVTVIMAFSLSACAGQRSARVTFDTKEYKTDYVKVTAKIPHISGLSDSSFQNQVNEQYKTTADTWITDFDAQAKEHTGTLPYEFVLDQSVKYNQNEFLSIVSELYTFTGGAHGATTWIAKNIDTQKNYEISVGDFFVEGTDYQSLLTGIMNKMVENNPQEYGDLWESPVFGDAQNHDFYIHGGNLVIYYQPYDLSYYARGFVEFPIEFKELQTYLKEEYYRLIK